ncbi:MAG: branched-chain amino acid ABC transporter permease [Chloroflexota bacterium]|nr:MAG: branched-chain amino acid ABC transporter permease [Chloroflexota bacterium]
MEILPQLIVNGTMAGTIYAIVAIGLVVIFSATGIVNFAQGEAATIGAYLGLVFYKVLGLPYWLSFIAAIAVAALFWVAVDRGLMRSILNAPAFTKVFLTFALAILIQNLLRFIFEDNLFSMPPVFGGKAIQLGIVSVRPAYLSILFVAAIVVAVLFFWFRRAKIGKAMRATSQNQEAAQLMGVSIKRIYSFTWAMGGALGAIAGLLLAPLFGIDPGMGGLTLIKGFMAAIIGGFTSLPGALLGGLLLGVIETLSGVYVSTAFKDLFTFAVLVVFILWRPQGLLGKTPSVKV